MMLAGDPVFADAVAELADTARATGADALADRLEVALDDDVKLLALTIDERADWPEVRARCRSSPMLCEREPPAEPRRIRPLWADGSSSRPLSNGAADAADTPSR